MVKSRSIHALVNGGRNGTPIFGKVKEFLESSQFDLTGSDSLNRLGPLQANGGTRDPDRPFSRSWSFATTAPVGAARDRIWEGSGQSWRAQRTRPGPSRGPPWSESGYFEKHPAQNRPPPDPNCALSPL